MLNLGDTQKYFLLTTKKLLSDVAIPTLKLGLASSAIKYSDLEKQVELNQQNENLELEGEPDLKHSFSTPMFENPELFLRASSLSPRQTSEANLYSPEPIVKDKAKKR